MNVEPDTIHTPSQDLTDKVDKQGDLTQQTETMDNVEHTVALEAAFLNLPDDESTAPQVPTNSPSPDDSHLQNEPVCPKPTSALGSSSDQEQNKSILPGPTNPTQLKATHLFKTTDSRKRKEPPTN